MKNLVRIVKWLEKTEGRDKLCKAIQYTCRTLMAQALIMGRKDGAAKLQSLFGAMRDARKLFRLGKSINEVVKLMEGLEKATDIETAVIGGFGRIGFMLYWLFDNIAILSKLKLISRDAKTNGKIASTFWLIGLLFTLIEVIREYIANAKKIKGVGKQPGDPDTIRKKIAAEKAKTKLIHIKLAKTLGDIIPAGEGAQLFERIFKTKAGDRLCGLGGLLSAVLTLYQLYE